MSAQVVSSILFTHATVNHIYALCFLTTDTKRIIFIDFAAYSSCSLVVAQQQLGRFHANSFVSKSFWN